MPNGTNMGPGWEQDANGQWVFNPGTANLNTGAPTAGDFTGTLGSLDYGQELAGSTLAGDWEKYFDAYDPTKEEMLGRHAATDIGQLGAAWGLQSQQLGEQYQEQLGGLFEQAGAGTMDLMSSWGGGGQTMTGRKGRQRKRIGSEASRQAGAYGMGLRQARDTGQLGLQQATTDIYQGLESDIYGEREKWEREQRSNLNTLLGMDIWDTGGSGLSTVTPSYAEGEAQFEAQEAWYQNGFPDEASYNAWVAAGSNPSNAGSYGQDPQAVVSNLNETVGLSDIRLKKDINHLFTLDNGVPIYTFKYKWSDYLQIGTMAQEIEGFMPDAVGEINGIKYVNYSHIWR